MNALYKHKAPISQKEIEAKYFLQNRLLILLFLLYNAKSNKTKLVHNLLLSDPYLLVEELQLDSVGGLEAIEATLDELTPLMLLLLLFLLLFALPMVAETEVLAAETETEALVMIVEELCPPFGATAKLLGGTFGGIGST